MSRFATAIETVPEPCQVLGTPLRPFSLGHHLMLKRLGLPFADAPLAECQKEDIVIGVAICAMRYEENLEGFLSGEWARMVKRWRRRVRRRMWLAPQSSWLDAETLFRAYLADGYKKPPVRRYNATSGLTITAPWEEMLKCELVMSGFTESEVLNGYLPARWYDYYTALELQAAARCKDPKTWRKVFWNESDQRRAEETA